MKNKFEIRKTIKPDYGVFILIPLLGYIMYFLYTTIDWNFISNKQYFLFNLMSSFIFFFIGFLIIVAVINTIRRHQINGDLIITISGKNIHIDYLDENKEEVIEWKDVKKVDERWIGGVLSSVYYLDLYYYNNEKTEKFSLVARGGRYGLSRGVVAIYSNYLLVKKEYYEDLLQFFLNKDVKLKKFLSFRKGTERME